jgi:hypothetical protein
LVEYDSKVGRACSTIKNIITKMVEKKYELAGTFAELIDEVLHAEFVNTGNDEEALQPAKLSDTSHHVCDGTSQVIRPTYSCPCPTDMRQPYRCP